jgi:Precorrin-6x reductase
LLIDATHPYAARISAHAALAAADVTIPLWAYRRPPWQPVPGDHWQSVADWAELMGVLLSFSRPFFTIGQEPLKHADQIPPKLHWLIRCLNCPPSVPPQMTVLTGRGPFRVEQELALMRSHGVDVLVSKNSGGSAIAAKLTAARQLGVPVVMLERPPLPPADLIFFDIEALAEAIWCA